MKHRGLGRGLEALIPKTDISENVLNSDQIIEMEIDKIYPNRNQPRKAFDEEKLGLLQESIESNGVIQPIIVTEENNGFQIIAGERRWRAARKAGLTKIPTIVRTYDDLMKAKISIIENVQRENLNVVEEAVAYQLLIENYRLTQEELARTIGKSRPYITNILRILNLSDEILENIVNETLSFGHAKALLMFPEEMRWKACEKTIDNKLSVRQLEKLSKKDIKIKKEIIKDAEIKKLEDMLADIFGTKVVIQAMRSKGKIEIDYYNQEDLERIIDIFKK